MTTSNTCTAKPDHNTPNNLLTTRQTHFSKNTLKARGWSVPLIKKLLGDADMRITNVGFRETTVSKLYLIPRVELAEQHPDFVARQERRAASQAANKASPIAARGIAIHVNPDHVLIAPPVFRFIDEVHAAIVDMLRGIAKVPKQLTLACLIEGGIIYGTLEYKGEEVLYADPEIMAWFPSGSLEWENYSAYLNRCDENPCGDFSFRVAEADTAIAKLLLT